jgi:hypothetical protein
MTDESLFAAALEIADTDRRAAFLDGACLGQPELRRQVEELLAAHERSSPFLEKPPLDVRAHGLDIDFRSPPPWYTETQGEKDR